MNLGDYLLAQEGLDWGELLADWRDFLSERCSVWLVNRFGDLFLVPEDGSVHILDVGSGTLERLADSRDQFASLLNQSSNGQGWLLLALVDECVAAGMTLKPGQCYSYKVPPMLGGAIARDNVEVSDLSVHYSILGQIRARISRLPPGTVVNQVTIGEKKK